MIRLKAGELLVEDLLYPLHGPDQILRQLCSYVDLIANVVFREYPAEALLAACICVSCVKIIDTLFNCMHDLMLSFCMIDL